jgi:hypothetical protein
VQINWAAQVPTLKDADGSRSHAILQLRLQKDTQHQRMLGMVRFFVLPEERLRLLIYMVLTQLD